MIFYKLDDVIERILDQRPCLEQRYLRETTGRHFEKEEAIQLWTRIIDHKWHISEQLQRDIGVRTAAVDYLENFYRPGSIAISGRNPAFSFSRLADLISQANRQTSGTG